MTTWLPAILIGWIVICTLWLANDRTFAHGRDRVLGGIVGFVFGLITGGVAYSIIRFVEAMV